MRYFMEEGGEYVYPLQQFIDDGKDCLLYEMRRDIGGEMFCKEDQEFVDDESCGNDCEYYNPCNGKSGRCRYLQNGFVETGREYVLTNNKLSLKEG